jgi:DNA-binding transcriptional LysR family regulator
MDRLDAMESFVAVADSGSFTKAAQIRGVSRPSISRAVSCWRALPRRLPHHLRRRS